MKKEEEMGESLDHDQRERERKRRRDKNITKIIIKH